MKSQGKKKGKEDMAVQFQRPAVSARETQAELEQDLDGGGPLFTIFNTLLDYPQAL